MKDKHQKLTNNPERASREINVKTSEGRHAGALHLEDIVRAFQWIWLATKVEGEDRKARNPVAVDSVLTVPRLLGADLGVEHLSDIGGQSNEGGAFQSWLVKQRG